MSDAMNQEKAFPKLYVYLKYRLTSTIKLTDGNGGYISSRVIGRHGNALGRCVAALDDE
jgi:hypothetical protein